MPATLSFVSQPTPTNLKESWTCREAFRQTNNNNQRKADFPASGYIHTPAQPKEASELSGRSIKNMTQTHNDASAAANLDTTAVSDYELSTLLAEIMQDLANESNHKGIPANYRILKNDKNIASKISFVINHAREQGPEELNKVTAQIKNVIEGYSENPSKSRFKLSEIVHHKFVESLSKSRHADNKGFMKKWETLLGKRLELFKQMSEKDLPCPIGSFGEKPPAWFQKHKREKACMSG